MAYQIMLLGFSGSGRTSFLVRMCADEFLPVNATDQMLEISPVFDYEKLNVCNHPLNIVRTHIYSSKLFRRI